MATSIAQGFQGVKDRVPAAIARALNRSIASAQTAMVREISRDLGLKSGTVRDAMRIKEAKPGDTSAVLSVSGKRIPLIEFNARGPQPSRGKGRGVTARFPGGQGRYPNAFIATVGHGHTGVFIRKATLLRKSAGAWSLNLPITELRGPSLPHVFRKYVPVALARGQEQLAKNLASEFRFALSRS